MIFFTAPHETDRYVARTGLSAPRERASLHPLNVSQNSHAGEGNCELKRLVSPSCLRCRAPLSGPSANYPRLTKQRWKQFYVAHPPGLRR